MFEKCVYTEGLLSRYEFNNQLYLNFQGQAFTASGELIPVEEKDGVPYVTANLWDGLREYCLLDLIAIVFKNVRLSCDYWNEISGFVIDGNYKNLEATNVGYRFRTVPLYHKKWLEFAIIPMYTEFGIHQDGALIRFSNGVITDRVSISLPNAKKHIKGGYANYAIRMDVESQMRTRGRHRLLCLAYKPYPDNVDKLDVNHIDGIPASDDLSNLEWATRSQNNYHAVGNGLLGAKAILVRNVFTGEVTEYPSITQAAFATGMRCDEGVRWRLSKGINRVWKGGLQYKLKEDPSEWPLPGDAKKELARTINAKTVHVRNCRTGEVLTFNSVAKAHRSLKHLKLNIEWMAYSGIRKPVRGWQVKYAEEDWVSFTKDEIDRELPRRKTVRVVNEKSGVNKTYPSLNEFYRTTRAWAIHRTLSCLGRATTADGTVYTTEEI